MEDYNKLTPAETNDLFPKGSVVGLSGKEKALIMKALGLYLHAVMEESPASAHSVERAMDRIERKMQMDWEKALKHS